MYEGRIIEFIDQGNFFSALCLQDKGNKLHLVTLTNREFNLPPKRAMLVSKSAIDMGKSREELLGKLRQTEESRERLKSQVEVFELWELVKAEGESFDGKYLAELCFGEVVTDDHISALVRSLFEDKLYFKMKDGRFLPNPEERIDQILKQREEEAAREELLTQGSKWLQDILDDKIVQEPPCKEEVIKLLIDLAVFGKESTSLKYAKELLARIGVTDIGEARGILHKLGIWGEDENLDLIRHDIRTSFSEEVLHALKRVEGSVPEEKRREDLRGLEVFTIDGALTRDFDDALSVTVDKDEIYLGVHITDVAGVIPLDSVLDREAAQRASSLYLPCLQIPMLPHALSQDMLSLRQNCDRPAISLLCRFDMEGHLLEHRFTPSWIRVRERLDYDQVDAVFPRVTPLHALHRLTQILHHRRIDQGAVVLSLPEIAIRLDSNSRIVLETVNQNTPSRTMVAESMILYNWLSARFCRENRIPILYRAQEEPGERIPVDEDNYVFYVFKQRRKLSPLMVDTEPKPHSGLGLDAYTNASSPIRRYADLVVQRQIRNALLGEEPAYGPDQLEKIRIALGTILKDLEMVKRNRFRYWMQKYFLQHKGETFPAIVLDEMKNRYRILLSDFLLAVEMKRQNGQELHEGQHVQVRISKSDPWNDLLKIEIAGP